MGAADANIKFDYQVLRYQAGTVPTGEENLLEETGASKKDHPLKDYLPSHLLTDKDNDGYSEVNEIALRKFLKKKNAENAKPKKTLEFDVEKMQFVVKESRVENMGRKLTFGMASYFDERANKNIKPGANGKLVNSSLKELEKKSPKLAAATKGHDLSKIPAAFAAAVGKDSVITDELAKTLALYLRSEAIHSGRNMPTHDIVTNTIGFSVTRAGHMRVDCEGFPMLADNALSQLQGITKRRYIVISDGKTADKDLEMGATKLSSMSNTTGTPQSTKLPPKAYNAAAYVDSASTHYEPIALKGAGSTTSSQPSTNPDSNNSSNSSVIAGDAHLSDPFNMPNGIAHTILWVEDRSGKVLIVDNHRVTTYKSKSAAKQHIHNTYIKPMKALSSAMSFLGATFNKKIDVSDTKKVYLARYGNNPADRGKGTASGTGNSESSGTGTGTTGGTGNGESSGTGTGTTGGTGNGESSGTGTGTTGGTGNSDSTGTGTGTVADSDTVTGTKVATKKTSKSKKFFFKFGRTELDQGTKQWLDRLAAALQKSPNRKMRVTGYTDSTGSTQMNQRLSLQRAQAIKKYLTDKGVAESQLEEKGLGESDPIASNGTAEGRARNRRVELTLL